MILFYENDDVKIKNIQPMLFYFYKQAFSNFKKGVNW